MRQLQEQSPIQEAPRWLKQIWLGYEPPPAVVKPAPLPEPPPLPVEEPKIEDTSSSRRPPSLSPPFDLEPHEFPPPGKAADIPKILADRQAKKLEKAQARREARRRKLEKLRA